MPPPHANQTDAKNPDAGRSQPASAESLWQSQPTLSGDLVTLRPLAAEDVECLATIMTTDREVIELTGSVSGPGLEAPLPPLPELLDIYARWAASSDRIVLGVEDNDTGQIVGEVVLKDHDQNNRSASFRGLIGTRGRDRGLGTEAVSLIVHYGLSVLNLHRIALEVYAFNPRAIRVYTKVGFVHEGIGRDALWFDGQWVDVHYMAILGDTKQAAP